MLKKKRRLNTVQKFWGECVCSDGAFGCSCDILDNDQKTSSQINLGWGSFKVTSDQHGGDQGTGIGGNSF